jgi:hypothetical protein
MRLRGLIQKVTRRGQSRVVDEQLDVARCVSSRDDGLDAAALARSTASVSTDPPFLLDVIGYPGQALRAARNGEHRVSPLCERPRERRSQATRCTGDDHPTLTRRAHLHPAARTRRSARYFLSDRVAPIVTRTSPSGGISRVSVPASSGRTTGKGNAAAVRNSVSWRCVG